MNATANYLRDHCDGAGPHGGPHEVRLYPLGGGGNSILCQACAARENQYRYERGIETNMPENWPKADWYQCKIYGTENED